MKLLHIDSSISGGASASRQLTAGVVDHFRRTHRNVDVIRRDLDADPLPHLDSKHLAAMAPTTDSAAETREALAKGFAALEEFQQADVIVIGAPMYNFGVPSQLKAWIDRIAVAGKTFRYTEQGPVGLSGGKKVIIASSRGGIYAHGTPGAAMDFQENYLRAVFGFLGITDIEFVRAEGIAFGPEQRQAALNGAFDVIPAVAHHTVTARAA
jgi:FMN-dependent NADH-azoreductase